LIITNMITFYSFLTGQVLINDYSVRVQLDVEGQKESIYTAVLLSFVYTFSLYFVQHESKLWEKGLFLSAILSIYLALITSFSRGDLVTIILISIIYVMVFSRKVTQAMIKVSTLMVMLVGFYLIFGNILREKGYDPIEKISQTAEFAADVDNPGWDNGRSLSRSYALDAWGRNLWTGVGYDVLFHWGLPEEVATAHNFIITSLFHRGIVGTLIYLLILFLLFQNSARLWFLLNKEDSFQNDILKLLIIASFFWLIPFWNQEVIWEKYSLSVQFMYFGLITNIYSQKSTEERLTQQARGRSIYIPV
ncbi:MAG: O-antigen ligase family protein, partial [Segetibacter sp.]